MISTRDGGLQAHPDRWSRFRGADHFTVLEELRRPDGRLVRAVMNLVDDELTSSGKSLR